MSTIIAEQLELNKMHHINAFCKLGPIMRAYNNQSECFFRQKLTVKELNIMHENSLNLPSGFNMDEQYNTLYEKSPPEGLAALQFSTSKLPQENHAVKVSKDTFLLVVQYCKTQRFKRP